MDFVNSLMNADVDMAGKVHCVILVFVTQAASTALVFCHGSATVMKDGVASFVIKISTTAQIISHAKMVEHAQILDMVLTRAVVLKNTWGKTVKV